LVAALTWYGASGKQESPQLVVAPEPPAPPAVGPPVTATHVSATELEWQAFDSQGDERSRRYVEAGDLYLELEADYAAALRCYSQALADASPRNLEFAPNDSWLLLTLKNARKQGVNQ
jgi:hypothetical protein